MKQTRRVAPVQRYVRTLGPPRSPEENRVLDECTQGLLTGEFDTIGAAARACVNRLRLNRSGEDRHAWWSVCSILAHRVRAARFHGASTLWTPEEDRVVKRHVSALLGHRYRTIKEATEGCASEFKRLRKERPGKSWGPVPRSLRSISWRLYQLARAAGRAQRASRITAEEREVYDRYAHALVDGRYGADVHRAEGDCHRDLLALARDGKPARTLSSVQDHLPRAARKLGWSWQTYAWQPEEWRILERYVRTLVGPGAQPLRLAAQACWAELQALRRRRQAGGADSVYRALKPATIEEHLSQLSRDAGRPVVEHWPAEAKRVINRYAQAFVQGRYRLIKTAAPVMTNVSNTAPAPGGLVIVNADIFDTLLGPGPVTAELMYSVDGELNWTTIGMTRVGEPGYDSTFTASFPVPGSGTVYYYLRANDGVSYATQAPVNLNDAWPPPDNLLARITDEPAGDTVNAEGPFLDLTGVYMCYSNDCVYAMLTNNSTGWPLYRFPTPWYVYTVAFHSRQMPTDSFALVLTHANVVGLFTTGLALFNRYANSFQRVGDIDFQTSGNRLYLRCPWTSITSRPEFGPWPNSDKFLATGAATLSYFGPGNWYTRDITDTASFYCLGTPSFNIGQNRAPVLSNADVQPRSGLPGTVFRFQVRYTDLDNNPPVLHAVIVDAETLSLIPHGHRHIVGTDFAVQEQVFATGTHSFRFVFDDGMARVMTSADSFTVFGTAVADAGTSVQESFRAQPNPFRNRVRFRGVARETWLEIRSNAGRLVRRIKASSPDVLWDGLDESGHRLPPGIYLARLIENNRSRRLRLIHL